MSLTVGDDNLLIFVLNVKCAKSFAKPSDKCLQAQVSAGITIMNTNKSILVVIWSIDNPQYLMTV